MIGNEGNEQVSIEIAPNASTCHPSNRSNYELLRSMVDAAEQSLKNNKSQSPKIRKVPPLLRETESNNKCYAPLVVSIGPFHHGRPELKPMQDLKILLAKKYADQSNVPIDELYRKVADMVNDARNSYADGSTQGFDDAAFALMMFLDACFILQFIYCIVDSHDKDLLMTSHDVAYVRRDLFLLENQLPYQVLKLLMSSRFEKDQGEKIMVKFIRRSRSEHPDGFRADAKPFHLLDLVRTQFIDADAFNEAQCFLRGGCSYGSAMKLKQVGIYCRPSKSGRLSDISFKSSCGFSARLMLPRLTIDDSSKSLFSNLVAYEACPDSPNDFGVSSYICFMNSLIEDARDVEELRSKGILINFLGSDQQVADLFNEISTNLVPNPGGFVEAKQNIEKHLKSKIKVWMAEWRHAHFSSPWTVIALIVAIVVINLSLLQTIFAAFQTYLTAYPPKK